jgi:hypothetical protein
MIIVKLMGGLGNQLFQYAAGRSLSIHKKTTLELDISGFDHVPAGVTKRKFELDAFDIPVSITSQSELDKRKQFSFTDKALNKLLPNHRKRYYDEPHFHFDENFYKASASASIVGYWQSEKYFAPVANIIRKDLAFRQETISKNKNLMEQIGSVNSVSVHVRRGDYVNDDHTARMHGNCGLDHYEAAVKLLDSKTSGMHLFVFSDDIAWAKDNFKFPFKTVFVEDSNAHAIDDLYLMSHCKHNIIANSSFSWWAAWLNNNQDKIVIAPSKWFGEFKADTKDLYPAGWIKI